MDFFKKVWKKSVVVVKKVVDFVIKLLYAIFFFYAFIKIVFA